jgi:hypothetical protein
MEMPSERAGNVQRGLKSGFLAEIVVYQQQYVFHPGLHRGIGVGARYAGAQIG